jgi:hypothetical protein
MSERVEWLEPDWPVPSRVRVLSTLRSGGVSRGPYESLNLAAHVADRVDAVTENRRRLSEAAGLPDEPLWLEQVHGCDVVRHDGRSDLPRADAAMAGEAGRVCAVLTADCLPLILADRAGTRVAAAHCGWRGLAGGVVEATVVALDCAPRQLVAWLGPAIGQDAFEVGGEVRDAFLRRSAATEACFRANERGRYQADLYGLARVLLRKAGVTDVQGGDWCTASDAGRFFSYRRDGTTGRMATLAWLA